jgi:hypothetical protein
VGFATARSAIAILVALIVIILAALHRSTVAVRLSQRLRFVVPLVHFSDSGIRDEAVDGDSSS